MGSVKEAKHPPPVGRRGDVRTRAGKT
jgi:hypothetical protein